MSTLAEIIIIVLGIIVWVLGSPIVFQIIAAGNFTGVEQFFLILLPWVVLITLVGLLIFRLRFGASS